MDITSLPRLLTPLDVAAVALLFVTWAAITVLIERGVGGRASVSSLMTEYRREWMRQTITRNPKVYDALVITSLRQSTAFFASTSMFVLGGLMALIANIDRLSEVASDLTLEQTPAIVWEAKLAVVLFLVTNAFLKFVWSHRVFGYCSILMAAVPNDPDDPVAPTRVEQATELNNSAARSFNRGLRSVYFALGSLAWLLDALPLMIAVLVTAVVLWRREFNSATRAALLRARPQMRP